MFAQHHEVFLLDQDPVPMPSRTFSTHFVALAMQVSGVPITPPIVPLDGYLPQL